MITKKIFLSVLGLVLLASCETDFENPNSPTVESVTSSTQGLTSLIVGTQFNYAVTATSAVYTSISASGFTTGELVLLNAGNADLAALANGGSSLAPDNPVVTNLWTSLNLVRRNGELLYNNADRFPAAADANTVRVFGNFYRALAIGTMSQFWESVIIQTGSPAEFVSRQAGLQEAVALLGEASTLLQQNGVPSANVTSLGGTNINLRNSVLALTARYNLMLGQNQAAITAAQAVDLASTSVFDYTAVAQNPVFRSSLTTRNVYDARENFGLTGSLAPADADGRRAFYLTPNAANGKGFFESDTDAIPVYLPGEMLLIRAEAHARLNQLDQARTLLNQVLTKTNDAFGVNANLPEYSGAVTQEALLQEIYRNRAIELYMSGLKLEDSRRFGRPGPGVTGAERNRNFYPYPLTERGNNPNTPNDPAI